MGRSPYYVRVRHGVDVEAFFEELPRGVGHGVLGRCAPPCDVAGVDVLDVREECFADGGLGAARVDDEVCRVRPVLDGLAIHRLVVVDADTLARVTHAGHVGADFERRLPVRRRRRGWGLAELAREGVEQAPEAVVQHIPRGEVQGIVVSAYHARLEVDELHARGVQSNGGPIRVELFQEAAALRADADAGCLVGSDGGWAALEDADGMTVRFQEDAVEEAS